MSKVIPLESNPDVINKFMANLGVPAHWQVTDVYGLDEDSLAIIPQPVLALILLFPTPDMDEDHLAKEKLVSAGQVDEITPKVYYMKQYLNNACGTVALIHSIANNLDNINLQEGCLKQFLDKTSNSSPEERGKLLENDQGIVEAHKAIAREGQTAAPEEDEEVDHHFVAFVSRNGHLYELDGARRLFPVDHGPTSPEKFLSDAARVVKEFIAKDPNNLRFTVMALAPSFD